MKGYVLAVATAFLLPAQICSGDEQPEHGHHHTLSPDAPRIELTINPEARVSVVLVGALTALAPCGTIIDLPVKIVNQAFLTATLEAQFVGNPPADVTLDFHPEPLKGLPDELRGLHITLTEPDPTDLTIAFRAHNVIPDLGGRDRVHLLMRCLSRRPAG